MRNFAGSGQHVPEQRAVHELVGGDGEVGEAEQLGEPGALPEDRHRLLVADDRHRHDRHTGAHRDLHESAPAEAPELVAVAHELAGGLGALGEHEHELPVVVQEAVRVVGVRGDAAGARPQRAEDGQLAEEVLGQAVDRAQQLGLDAVHDDRGVGRDGPAVVGRPAARHRRAARARAPPTRHGASGGTPVRRGCGRGRGRARCGPRRRPASRSSRSASVRPRPGPGRRRSAGVVADEAEGFSGDGSPER